MILPTKHIDTKRSLIWLGGLILQRLMKPQTVTSLWEDLRGYPEIGTFERFSLALDFLYTIGVIEFQEHLLRRCT
ncbi:ABC-three component system middle component 6 [Pseudanabaena sp. FACHB-1998]|uniref:ABC-three component system middle component 6 n=1 Tax=Pseudanabaena sp. FACHB-1998 TaxID=2692858 RepID=UPI00321F9459